MRLRFLLLLLAAVTVLTVTALAWLYESRAGLQALKRQAAESLSLKSSNVATEIERFRYLPFVLGQDERIQRLLDDKADLELADIANRYLETINNSAGSNALYVLDVEGLTLASSNWNSDKSFVGERFGFRPYFSGAISGGEGRYYAVGAKTGEPGYFLARRIETAAGNVGVAAAKVDLSVLVETWMAAGEQVGLVDGAGIIFLSSIEGWTYQPLFPLSGEDRNRILSEKQYPQASIDSPPLLRGQLDTTTDLYLPVQGKTTLLQFVQIADHGWRMFAAYDVAPVYLTANLVAAIVFLGAALLFALGFYLLEHRQRIRANQLREILENMSAGVAVFDRELRLVAWNDKYIRLNSYPDSLVRVGRPYADIIKYNIARGDHGPGDPEKQLQQRLDRLQQHRQLEVRRPDGTWVDIVRSRMPNGTLIQTYTDVTERKQAAAELDAHRNNLQGLVRERTAELVDVNARLQETVEQLDGAKRSAEQANREKTTFLNSVSHDIRNPLNAILGYAGLVLSNAKESLPAKQYQNLQKLAAKGRELNEMVSDFLDYSRADRVTTAPFALAPLIQECLVTIEPMIDSQRVQLVCDVPDDLPMLVQDERKLRRIIINLLSNAAKFTERGTISLTARRLDGEIEIAVADTGIGIAGEFLDHIFEEFRRVEARGERPREGTGLGLAICRRFVTLMGGQIAVLSTPGKGSVFTLSIPRVHPRASAPEQVAEREGQRRADPQQASHQGKVVGANGQATLLIVDDSRENRDFLVQLLEKQYRVLVAEDGKRAIQMAQQDRPDLVLMDLSLPIVDGWEATRRIKADAAGRSIPIVAVSAHATAQDRDEARAAGCDDFLAKPVDETALLDTLRRYLGTRIGEALYGGAVHHPHR
jgi:histidine kinase